MKLESVLRPIKSNSIEGHEKELQDKMIEIQLEYVDKIFSKKISPLSKESKIGNIQDLVSEYTEIPDKIMRNKPGSDGRELLALKEKILNKISDLHEKDHDHWIEKSEEFVNKELKEYKNKETKENRDNDYPEKRAGLISFNIGTNFGRVLPDSGISNEDICLNIHFEDFYKQQKGDIKNLFSQNSLEKLALKIVDEYPETKAVVGESWLMDTPIAKRIGFTIYNRDLEFSNGPFWGQFIDSNGQIKNKEISKFLETGKSPYRIAAGAIKVEDFLRKYLPQEKRGKIKLRESTQESLDFIKDLNRIINELNDKWDSLSFDEIVALMNSNTIFANYFKTSDGKAYIDIFKKAKELNLKKNEIHFIQYENKDEIKKKFDKYIEANRNKYTEKEVVI